MSVELSELRTELTKTYRNPDGSRTLRSTRSPLRYCSGTQWLDLDNAVVSDPDRPGGLRNKANAWVVRFVPLLAGVTLKTPRARPLSLRGATSVAPVVEQ